MLPLMFYRCYVSNAFIQPGDQLLLASKTNDSSGPPITRVSFPLCLSYGNAEVFTRQSSDGKSNILISCGFNEKSATWDSLTTFILQALMFISDFFFSQICFFFNYPLFIFLFVSDPYLSSVRIDWQTYIYRMCVSTYITDKKFKFSFWKKSHRLSCIYLIKNW